MTMPDSSHAQVPSGWVQRANAEPRGAQDQPASAVLADGSLVVVFVSKSSNDFGSSAAGNIHARIFQSDGTVKPVSAAAEAVLTPDQGEFLINSETNAAQWHPSVTALVDGGFFVVWSDEHQHDVASTIGSEQILYSVMGRVFNADGSPRTDQFRVNQQDSGYEWNPQVITLANGDVVVAWISKAGTSPILGSGNRVKGHVVFREFDGHSLLPLGDDVIATAGLALDQLPDVEFSTQSHTNRCYPALSANLADGLSRFALAWYAGNPDVSNDDDQLLRLQYQPTVGGALSYPIQRIDQVNDQGGVREVRDLAVTNLAWGNGWVGPTVYAWSERTVHASTGTVSTAIRLQYFSPGGDPYPEPITLVSDATRNLRYPKLIPLADGGAAISYVVEKLGSQSAEVRLLAIDASGQPRLLDGQNSALDPLSLVGVGSSTSLSDADLVMLHTGQLVVVNPDFNQLGDSDATIKISGLTLVEEPVLLTIPEVDPDGSTGPDECLILHHGFDHGPIGGFFSDTQRPTYPNSESARKRFVDSLLALNYPDSSLVEVGFEATEGWGYGNFAGISGDYSVDLVPPDAIGPVSLPFNTVTESSGLAGRGSLLWQDVDGRLAVRFDLAGTRLTTNQGMENPGIGVIDDSNDVDRGFSTTNAPNQYSGGQWLEVVPGYGVDSTSLTIELDRPAKAVGFYLIGREESKNPVEITLRLADGSIRIEQPRLWPEGDTYANIVPAGTNTDDDGSVQFIGLQVDDDCSPILAVILSQPLYPANDPSYAPEDITAIDDLIVLPAVLSDGFAPIDLGAPEFPVPGVDHVLDPKNPGGTHLVIDSGQPAAREHRVFTSGSPDWVEVIVDRDVTVTLQPSGRWDSTHVARHVGSGGIGASGSVVGLAGLNRFFLTTTDIDEGQTTLVLPDSNNALFLDDLFSPQHSDLGSAPVARLNGIEAIWMGDGSGTSIVDLTSNTMKLGDVIVHGGSTPLSRQVFWGGDANERFVAYGADNDVSAGPGTNEIALLPYGGRDTIRYVGLGNANDTITNFEPWRDRVVLQSPNSLTTPSQIVVTKSEISSFDGSTDAILSWQDNHVRLVGQGYLAEQWNSWIVSGPNGSQEAELPAWIQLI